MRSMWIHQQMLFHIRVCHNSTYSYYKTTQTHYLVMQDFSSSHVKQIWCILSRNKKSKNTNITSHVSSYAKEDEHLQRACARWYAADVLFYRMQSYVGNWSLFKISFLVSLKEYYLKPWGGQVSKYNNDTTSVHTTPPPQPPSSTHTINCAISLSS